MQKVDIRLYTLICEDDDKIRHHSRDSLEQNILEIFSRGKQKCATMIYAVSKYTDLLLGAHLMELGESQIDVAKLVLAKAVGADSWDYIQTELMGRHVSLD